MNCEINDCDSFQKDEPCNKATHEERLLFIRPIRGQNYSIFYLAFDEILTFVCDFTVSLNDDNVEEFKPHNRNVSTDFLEILKSNFNDWKNSGVCKKHKLFIKEL